jgi:hypothetical protein
MVPALTRSQSLALDDGNGLGFLAFPTCTVNV